MQVKLSNGMMMGSFTMGIGVAKLRLSDGGLASLVDANFVREGRYIDPVPVWGQDLPDPSYGCSDPLHCRVAFARFRVSRRPRTRLASEGKG